MYGRCWVAPWRQLRGVGGGGERGEGARARGPQGRGDPLAQTHTQPYGGCLATSDTTLVCILASNTLILLK